MSHPENLGQNEKAKPKKKKGMEEKETQVKGTEILLTNLYKKFSQEIQEYTRNFKEMHIKVQESYRTRNRLNQKR